MNEGLLFTGGRPRGPTRANTRKAHIEAIRTRMTRTAKFRAKFVLAPGQKSPPLMRGADWRRRVALADSAPLSSCTFICGPNCGQSPDSRAVFALNAPGFRVNYSLPCQNCHAEQGLRLNSALKCEVLGLLVSYSTLGRGRSCSQVASSPAE